MFRRHRSTERNQPEDPLEHLKALPLVGETIQLHGDVVLQRPNPEVIKFLQAIDQRVRYVPADVKKAKENPGWEYFRALTDQLPLQVIKDFPGPINRTAQRGTVVSLRDEFPHFYEMDDWDFDFELGHKIKDGAVKKPMNNVLTILRTGSDRGGVLGKLGMMMEYPEGPRLFAKTEEFLQIHTNEDIRQLLGEGEFERADNLFPGLLVYDLSVLGKKGEGSNVDNPQALAALYITDRIIELPNQNRVQAIGGSALQGNDLFPEI